MITIVTLYDGSYCETYVGAVWGSLSEEQRRDLARAFDASVGVVDDDYDVEGRYMYFRETEACQPEDLGSLSNADDAEDLQCMSNQ